MATGCRFGEAAGLRWCDVDLEHARVAIRTSAARVPRAYRNGGPGWELARPTTDSSERELPLPPFGVLPLVRQLELVGELRDRAAAWGAGLVEPACRACDRRLQTPCADHELVFPNTRGTPLREDHVLANWRRVLEAAELPAVRMHDLRPTLGTLQRRAGTDLRTIQDLLGHASITMTSAIYVGGVPEALRAAADRLEQMLSAAKTAASAEAEAVRPGEAGR